MEVVTEHSQILTVNVTRAYMSLTFKKGVTFEYGQWTRGKDAVMSFPDFDKCTLVIGGHVIHVK